MEAQHEAAFDPGAWQRQLDHLRENVGQVVVGQRSALELVLVALMANGHVLLEGVPGVAKTLLAKAFARSLGLPFGRIQFTPDLMPTDITGTSIFSMQDSRFHFRPGPIFTQVLLADEINRAPAKTQAALFEVMQERQATIDGTTHPMKSPFIVLATQNPIEQEGTYRLPEAQLDRFLFRVRLGYPEWEEEMDLLRRYQDRFKKDPIEQIGAVLSAETLQNGLGLTEQVHTEENILDYIARLARRSREHKDILLGASPRASLALLQAAKGRALLEGRMYVVPDDVQAVFVPVLNHRLLLQPERELDGSRPEEVLQELLETEEVPK
jgi:MoxR-like ATPase